MQLAVAQGHGFWFLISREKLSSVPSKSIGVNGAFASLPLWLCKSNNSSLIAQPFLSTSSSSYSRLSLGPIVEISCWRAYNSSKGRYYPRLESSSLKRVRQNNNIPADATFSCKTNSHILSRRMWHFSLLNRVLLHDASSRKSLFSQLPAMLARS